MGDRIEDHERFYREDTNEAKKRKIRQIQARGKQVLKKVVAEFKYERDAYIYEWGLITLYQEHLTNIRSISLLSSMHPVSEKVRWKEKPYPNLLGTRDVAKIFSE